MKILNKLINKKPAITVAETETTTTMTTDVKPGEWFTSKEHYLEFTAAFKNWINRGGYADSSHFLLYAILRNKDWKKGWTPPTKAGKIDEHAYKRSHAFYKIKSGYNEKYLLAPFDGTITTEMLMVLRENLDDIRGE